MDLASVVAALASVGVRVSGSTPNSSVQVDSSRACPTGLAGPEPSGTINDPGQHFQAELLEVNRTDEHVLTPFLSRRWLSFNTKPSHSLESRRVPLNLWPLQYSR